MKNENLKMKIKSNSSYISLDDNSIKKSKIVTNVEIYLIRKVKNKYWHYFLLKGKKYKIDESGLHYSFSLGEKVKLFYNGKKVDVKIEALLKPNSNGIKGLAYIVSLINEPSTELISSEKWIS